MTCHFGAKCTGKSREDSSTLLVPKPTVSGQLKARNGTQKFQNYLF
jgi:hypothetical protein